MEARSTKTLGSGQEQNFNVFAFWLSIGSNLSYLMFQVTNSVALFTNNIYMQQTFNAGRTEANVQNEPDVLAGATYSAWSPMRTALSRSRWV
jgi:hypothetical protein